MTMTVLFWILCSQRLMAWQSANRSEKPARLRSSWPQQKARSKTKKKPTSTEQTTISSSHLISKSSFSASKHFSREKTHSKYFSTATSPSILPPGSSPKTPKKSRSPSKNTTFSTIYSKTTDFPFPEPISSTSSDEATAFSKTPKNSMSTSPTSEKNSTNPSSKPSKASATKSLKKTHKNLYKNLYSDAPKFNLTF